MGSFGTQTNSPQRAAWGKSTPKAAPTMPKADKGTKPKGTLPKYQVSKKRDDGTWLNVGIFENHSKKTGEAYLGGRDKETDVPYYLNLEKLTLTVGENRITLKEYENDDGSSVLLGGGYRVKPYSPRPKA